MVLEGRRRLASSQGTPLKAGRRRNQMALAGAFVLYILLLLVFAGVIALPTAGSPGQGSEIGGPPPPPAIFTQAPPTALVHSASLTYGFLLFLGAVFLVNRRYGVFVPRWGPGNRKNT